MVVMGQEVEIEREAEVVAQPTHAHTQGVECAGRRGIGWHFALTRYALSVMHGDIWDMFVRNIKRMTNRQGSSQMRRARNIDWQLKGAWGGTTAVEGKKDECLTTLVVVPRVVKIGL